MLDIQQPETRFALESVRQASYLVRMVQAELVGATLSKSDHSPVTVGDYAAQALIGSLLERYYPHDALVAEEDSRLLCSPEQEGLLELVTRFVAHFVPQARSEQVCAWIARGQSQPARRYWTLDPIDGTKGYLRGDQYAVALALIEDDQVQLGALGCPNLADGFRPDLGGPGSLVIACRGQGAWTTSLASARDFDPLQVSNRSDPTLARLLRSFEAQHTNVGLLDELVSQLTIQADPVRLDSQAKYAILAAGKAEVLIRLLSSEKPNYREKIWDIAAGSIVVEEAGGRVSDLHGKSLDFSAGRELNNNRGILVTNGHLQQAFLDALASLGV
jgi:3'(2'), 5'-bisphosphate nucleotidase